VSGQEVRDRNPGTVATAPPVVTPARTEQAAVEPLLYRPNEGLPYIAADMLVRQGRTPEEVLAFLVHQTETAGGPTG
jgi:hypothetical protein